MNTVKKVVIVLSVLCYIAIALYAVCAIPMLFGYTPMPVTDDHLDKAFPVGSMFYYHKAELSEMQKGYVAVYNEGSERKTDYIISAEDVAITVCSDVVFDDGKYRYSPENEKTVPMSSVEGINKSPNFPLIGFFLDYVQNHVAIIVIIGVILSLRILFIYIDPKKESEKSSDADEQDSFEMSLGGLIGDTEKTAKTEDDIGSIFAQPVCDESDKKSDASDSKTDDNVTFENVISGADGETPSQLKDEEDVDMNAVISAHEKQSALSRNNSEVKEMKKEETKAQPKEPVSPAGAEEITNYINALAFDSSKDGAWYNADQVDQALDMITAKVYDALNAASSSNSSFGELIKVRTEKAEVEKTVMEKDVALLAANGKLSEAERKISEYEKEIANYKIMEQKVAKLIATLKAGKQND